MHYERVASDLQQAEKTIKMALKAACNSETEKTALQESLELVKQAREKCRLAQAESIQEIFTQGMRQQ